MKIIFIFLVVFVGTANASVIGKWQVVDSRCSVDGKSVQCNSNLPEGLEISSTADGTVVLIQNNNQTILRNVGKRDEISENTRWSYVDLFEETLRFESLEVKNWELNNIWIFATTFGLKNEKLYLVMGRDFSFPKITRNETTLYLSK